MHFLIGPATIALAVPLYSQMSRLKSIFAPLSITLFVGAATAVGSAAGLGWVFGATRETLLPLAPKSVTLPIAMGIAEKIGGLPSLTAVAVAVTGISGAIMARGLLDLVRIDDDAVRGFAVGITAHGIGVARAISINETVGAFAALSMGLNAIATTLLLPLAVRLFAAS